VGELVRILQAHKLARYPAGSFFDGLFAAFAKRRQLGREVLGRGTGKTRRATRQMRRRRAGWGFLGNWRASRGFNRSAPAIRVRRATLSLAGLGGFRQRVN
jgi:hypothetical protein